MADDETAGDDRSDGRMWAENLFRQAREAGTSDPGQPLPGMFFVIDRDGTIVEAYLTGDAEQRIVDVVHQLVGLSHRELLVHDPVGLQRTSDAIEAAFMTQTMQTASNIDSGSRRNRKIESIYLPIGANRLVNVVRDVTEQVERHEALEASEARFRLLTEFSLDVVALVDLDGVYRYVSPSVERVLGFVPDELVGSSAVDLVATSSSDDARMGIYSDVRAGVTGPIRLQMRHKNGTPIWFDVMTSPILGTDGQIEAIYSVARDIDQQVRAEQVSNENSERLRSLLQLANEVLSVVDADTNFTYVSESASNLYGYSPESLVGTSCLDLLHPDDIGELAQSFADFVPDSTATNNYVVRVKYRDSGWRWVEGRVRNELDNPAIGGIVSVMRDVTEERRLREDLLQSQKMEAVGRLAGAVAHDFNNLLTVILGYSELARGAVERGDDPAAELEHLEAAGDRAVALVDQLLSISRRRVSGSKNVVVDTVLGELEPVLRRFTGDNVRLQFHFGSAPSFVRIDPAHLEQVAINLVVNGIDALDGAGDIALRTSTMDSDAGDVVVIEVTDTGTGMDARTQAQMFEPYFTTKPIGEGTGLGMPTVFGLVSQAGGSIEVDSTVGAGTTIRVLLPVRLGEVADASHDIPTDAGSIQGSGERVLLVEDDPSVAAFVKTALERLGYNVFLAVSGTDALLVADEMDHQIDLLVTDLMLPGLGGRVVADRVRGAVPGLVVLFMSGFAGDLVREGETLDTDSTQFLAKPFGVAELSQAVHRLLHRDQQPDQGADA